MCACYYHLRRKGDFRDGQERLSPRASGLGVFLSPAAGVPTLPGVITELGMVPAEGVLSRGLSRGWRVGGEAVPGGAAVARTVGTRQGSHKVSKSGYLFVQLLDFGVVNTWSRQSSDGGGRHFHNLICHIGKVFEGRSEVGLSEHHPDVWGLPLEEQLS